MDAIDAPIGTSLRRYLALVPTEKKWSPSRTVRSFDFNKSFFAARIERQDIVASTIAIFYCDPTNPSGQIQTVRIREPFALDLNDKLLAGLA